MTTTLHVALGFEVQAAQDWRKIMPPPRKPANWKEETFQAKLPELLDAQITDAPYYPLTGRVNALWVYPVGGSEADAVRIEPRPTSLVTWCMKTGGLMEVGATSTVFYGVGLRRQLRKLAMQAPLDMNAARMLIDSPESPTKVDLISYCGVRDLFETAQSLAKAALDLDYVANSARDEALAVGALVAAYGFDKFAGKPGFSPLEW